MEEEEEQEEEEEEEEEQNSDSESSIQLEGDVKRRRVHEGQRSVGEMQLISEFLLSGSQEHVRSCLQQRCSAVSKTGRLCGNGLKCHQHSEAEKQRIRRKVKVLLQGSAGDRQRFPHVGQVLPEQCSLATGAN